jgi:hypothetical protein
VSVSIYFSIKHRRQPPGPAISNTSTGSFERPKGNDEVEVTRCVSDTSGVTSSVATYWTENGRQGLLEGDANGRGGAGIRNEVRARK